MNTLLNKFFKMLFAGCLLLICLGYTECHGQRHHETNLNLFMGQFDQIVMNLHPEESLRNSYYQFIDSIYKNPYSLILSDDIEELIQKFVADTNSQDYISKKDERYFFNLDKDSSFYKLLIELMATNSFFSEYYDIISFMSDIPPTLHDRFIIELNLMDLENQRIREFFLLHLSVMYLIH